MLTTFDVNQLYAIEQRVKKELKKQDGKWIKNIYHPMYFYPYKKVLKMYSKFIRDILTYEFGDDIGEFNIKALYFSPEVYDIISQIIHPDFKDDYLPSYLLDLRIDECYIDVAKLFERSVDDDG